MDTIKLLADITDAAQFERIATSVLRSAKASLYANLSHQGVNTDGKTIKAPLDNVGWVQNGEESMLVAAAHTTSSRDDLERKWLHDPATVTPRKSGGKPTQPAGDLVKAIRELELLRVKFPDLKATLALTCNREEPTKVRINAEALAATANVSLDIWSVSRIAQYLDTTADGQAIRHEYLGTPVVLLSKAELLHAGRQSLDERTRSTDPTSIVDRMGILEGSGHVVLSGSSGMGKSTICLEQLRISLTDGQAGLVLSDQTIRDAISLEEAVDMELRRHLPNLEPNAGEKALGLCSELAPLVIVIEDISRSQNPDILLNKVVGWVLQSISNKAASPRRNWRLLCPIWPRFLLVIDRYKDVQAAGIIKSIGLYSDLEATEAVRLRGHILGQPQNDMSAQAIARSLGCDPLLIGLHEFTGTGKAQDVITEYMNREFSRVVPLTGLTESDVEWAVERFGFQMLQHQCLTPSWDDAMRWLDREDDRKALRALVNNGSLLRIVRDNGKSNIEARHDRVLHAILAAGIAARFTSGAKDAFLSEPYFAEHVGSAAVNVELAASVLQLLMNESPLVAFFALKDAISRGSNYAQVAHSVIVNWLSLTKTQSQVFASRRWRGLGILAEIDSPIVLELTDRFPLSDCHHLLFEARFRNGDLGAGINWLTEYSFEISVVGQKELINYVSSRYGLGLIHSVAKMLESPDSSPRATRGALYLAGYLADPALASSVRSAWNRTTAGERDLGAFLWAAARVCGTEAATTLGPVCDAWASLPESDDLNALPTRSSLAAHGVSWKFREHPPRAAALQYFVDRAIKDDLRWPITYMLRGVDDPIAVRHLSEYFAECSRQAKSNGRFVDYFAKDEWKRRSEKQERFMSKESKECLLNLAINSCNDEHLRKQSFTLWEASVAPGDIAIAQTIPRGNLLHDIAVWARARRQDFSVIPELIEKIRTGNPGYWWQAGRYIWTNELTILLDESIQKINEISADDRAWLCEWLFPEHLLRLNISDTQQILIKYWDKVRTSPRFVQIALFLGTPELVALANQAIDLAEDKKKMLEYFSFTTELQSSGNGRLIRECQLEALKPHLELFSESDLAGIWKACNRGGWKLFCKTYLEPLLIASGSTLVNQLRAEPPFDLSDLEGKLNNEHTLSYLWLENNLKKGAERKVLLETLLAWGKEKGSVAALNVVGDIYSRGASRAEFCAFEQLALTFPGGEDVLEWVRFDIFNRTLN